MIARRNGHSAPMTAGGRHASGLRYKTQGMRLYGLRAGGRPPRYVSPGNRTLTGVVALHHALETSGHDPGPRSATSIALGL